PFFTQVPVTWDDTRVLTAKLGEYVVIARRKGNNWYIGALTDWTARDLEVDLSFLGDGNYQAEMFLDGLNAHRKAEDYQVEKKSVNQATKLNLPLKPGGGAAVRLVKQ
ncbi:MAG: glycoside hydrolase family 97 protein, partial [Bacteroidia bacterium]|nr:glycoside hydrolase family 97 protein [Bacteroidia bacterium]